MKHINLCSFILMIMCYILFFILSSVSYLKYKVITLTEIQPFIMLLKMTLVVFLLSIIGVFGVDNGKTALRSLITVLFSLILLIVLPAIIFFGVLFD